MLCADFFDFRLNFVEVVSRHHGKETKERSRSRMTWKERFQGTLLMLNLKVQMSRKPIVEERLLNIAGRFQLHSEPAGSSGDTFMTTWFDWVTTTENSGVVLFVLSTTSYQLTEPCSFENTTREGRGIDLDKNEKNETHRMMK